MTAGCCSQRFLLYQKVIQLTTFIVKIYPKNYMSAFPVVLLRSDLHLKLINEKFVSEKHCLMAMTWQLRPQLKEGPIAMGNGKQDGSISRLKSLMISRPSGKPGGRQVNCMEHLKLIFGSFHVKSTSIQTVVHHTISDFDYNFTHWCTVQIELFLIFSDFYVINWLIYRFLKFRGYSRLFATLTDSRSSDLNN